MAISGALVYHKHILLLPKSLSTAEETFSWRWKDPGGAWKTYSEETNKTIESHYEKDPRGFVLITHDNKQ